MYPNRPFKIKFLNPYAEVLGKLCDNKTLREVMTNFPIYKGAEDGVNAEHRPGFLPLLIRVLFPKMRKRTGRLGGRGAPGSARAAVLNFLAGLEPLELAPLLELLLQPMAAVFRVGPTALVGLPEELALYRQLALVPPEPWALALPALGGDQWLHFVDPTALAALEHRRRVGFLNALEDLVEHLGTRLIPYLPGLLVVLLRLLELGCSPLLESDASRARISPEEARELRSSTLKALSLILAKYPSPASIYEPVWPLFFQCARVLAPRLRVESNASKAPPLLDAIASLVSDPVLSLRLAEPDAAPVLAECLAVLSLAVASGDAKDVSLGIAEVLLGHGGQVVERVLKQHVTAVLGHIRTSIGGDWDADQAMTGKAGKHNLRQLAVLEAICPMVADPEIAEALTDALVPLLSPKDKRGRSKSRMNEPAVARALGALTGIWSAQGRALSQRLSDAGRGDTAPWAYAAALSPLFVVLNGREARLALCRAAVSLGEHLLPGPYAEVAALLSDLSAMSAKEIDEPDYDRRMSAYGQLAPGYWSGMEERVATPLLLGTCFDLRNDKDLALRHAAASALSKFVEAATRTATGLGLCQRVLLPQIKAQLLSNAAAVRQEHLALLRQLVLSFGTEFPDLRALCNEQDPEVDFFLNISSIQLHRRGRALQRLTRHLQDPGCNLTVGSMLGLLAPMLQQMVVEGRAAETDIGRELKQRELDADANVAEHAATCLGALASRLPWIQYDQLLNRFLRLLGAKSVDPAHIRLLVKAVCAVIDAFHFDLGEDLGADEGQPAAAVPATAEQQDQAESEEEEGDAIAARPSNRSLRSQILTSLVKRALPSLRQHLVVDQKSVRAPVAVALVRVLKLLPEALERHELPKVLQVVTNLLKHKFQEVRDEARKTLAAMVKGNCLRGGPCLWANLSHVLEPALISMLGCVQILAPHMWRPR